MQQTADRPHSLPDEGLNGAQLAAVADGVRRAIEMMKLKQWCVEKALETDVADRVALAREIYCFIVTDFDLPPPGAE